MNFGYKRRTARLISNLLNPFSVSIIIIILISVESTTSAEAALKWTLLALAVSILPIFSIVFYLVRSDRLDDFFINVRKQRYRIYFLSAFCSAIGCGILYSLGAPPILVAAFVAGLATVIVYMGINFLWKISVHTAFAASSITVLVFLYGPVALIAAVSLPLIGWSRIELEHHTPSQVATGALIAAVVVLVVFSLFGLVGAGSV